MKTLLFLSVFTVLSLDTCNKGRENNKYDWIVLYGEMNDQLSYREVKGDYFYNNIEYFFIDSKTKMCYRNINTNQITRAEALIDKKINYLRSGKINEQEYQQVKVFQVNDSNINLEFFDREKRQLIYKVRLSDTVNKNASVFTLYKKDTVEVIWTDRKSRTTSKKKFKKKLVANSHS